MVYFCPAALRWVNTLGMAASHGVDAVLRHSFFDYGYSHLVDQHFNPLPVSLLSADQGETLIHIFSASQIAPFITTRWGLFGAVLQRFRPSLCRSQRFSGTSRSFPWELLGEMKAV